MADSVNESTPLLAADEAPPFTVCNLGASSRFVLVGDHAGRAVPRSLNDLGLRRDALERHIGWDIGVQGLGERLAVILDAVFIAQRFSRLVIDCNRDPGRADSVREVSDGVSVPGNLGLGPEARARRVGEVFAPYHARIGAELDERAHRGRASVLIALHSFTPVLDGEARPWRFGVLHLGASALSAAMLGRLRAALGAAEVGDNQPYAMDGTDYTAPHHAIARGLDYLELEVRQDLIAEAAGQTQVAALIAPLMTAALADTGPVRP